MKFRRYYCGVILSMVLAACSENSLQGLREGESVHFSSNNEALTRVYNNLWEVGDEIGIFVYDVSDMSICYYNNIGYRTKNTTEVTSTAFDPVDVTKTIYNTTFTGSYVMYKAYYPFDNTLSGTEYVVDVSDQADTERINFLMADNVPATSTETNITFDRFNHKTAVVKLSLSGLPLRGLSGNQVSVKMTNVFTQRSFDLKSATYEDDASLKANGKVNMSLLSDFTYQAIVVPQETKHGRFAFEVDCNGKRYFTMPNSSFDIIPGRVYEMESHLNAEYNNFESVKITDWKDGGVPGAESVVMVEQITSIKFVYIPAGTFYMGDMHEPFLHQVQLTTGFHMSQFEITNEQYCQFLNKAANVRTVQPYGHYAAEYDYSTIKAGAGWKPMVLGTGAMTDWCLYYDPLKKEWMCNAGYENYPVSNVTWYGAKCFALWVGADLPTEAQWEYAARGYIKDKATEKDPPYFYWGDDPSNSKACFDEPAPKEVGSYPPNNYHLYDMIGNVAEYCNDGYDLKYGLTDGELSGLTVNPTGPSTYSLNVLKNGGYSDTHFENWIFERRAIDPEDITAAINICGFRIVK